METERDQQTLAPLMSYKDERALIRAWVDSVRPNLDEKLKTIVRRIDDRNRDDFDSVIAITGGEGMGKSTLAAIIGMLYDGRFGFDRNELFQPTHKEIKERLTKLPKYSVIIADEAIRVLYKLKWQDKAQQYLNQVYALCRQENQVTILCMPRFTDFNEFFRNHRIKIWIHVYQRGKAMMFVGDENPFVTDVFWIAESMKIVDKAMRRNRKLSIDDDIADRVFSKVRCYVMNFSFPDMPDELKKLYKDLKEKYSYANMDLELEAEDTAAKQRNKLYFVMAKLLGFAIPDIAIICKVESAHVRVGCEKGEIELGLLEIGVIRQLVHRNVTNIVKNMKAASKRFKYDIPINPQNSTFVSDRKPENEFAELEKLAEEAGIPTGKKDDKGQEDGKDVRQA